MKSCSKGHSDSYNLFSNIIAKDAKIAVRVASNGDCTIYDFKALSEEIGQDDGGHGFYDNRGAKGEADVVAAGDAGFGDAGGRLERHAEHKRVAVGNAAVHAAGVVGKGRLYALVAAAAVVVLAVAMTTLMLFAVLMVAVVFLALTVAALVLREGVVVLGAAHGGGFEAVAELDAADAGDREDSVGNFSLYAIPERFSHADGKALRNTLNNATK